MDRDAGAILIVVGLLIAAVGLLAFFGGLSWFGHLPGDIRIEGDTTRVYIPLASMLVVSVVLSLGLAVVRRLR